MSKLARSVISLMLVSCAGRAGAQMSAPPIPTALPDVTSISPANAAGVLQYCLGHQLVSSSAADIVLTPLTQKQGVTASPDYSAGKSGQIITHGKTFSLGQASDYLKSQACNIVFEQAKQFK